MIGRTISGYRVVSRVGEGGMGVVYRARDERLGRDVVLKFLSPHLLSDPAARLRLAQEARAASGLDHPNICTIYEIEETADGELFIAMAFYEGETLTERIARGPLPVDEAHELAVQLARGLAAAHDSGIVHRDVKPANVLVTRDGTVKILDFGLAKFAGAMNLTQPGTTLGTIAYMSPEQLRGEAVDARADVWSFGAVLYEMLTGARPFGATGSEAVSGILAPDLRPEPLGERRPTAPPALREVVESCLRKQPGERPASMSPVLERLVGGSSPEPRATAATPRRAPAARWRRVSLALVAALLVGLLGAAVTRWAGRAPAGPEQRADAPSRGASAKTPLARLAVLPFASDGAGAGSEYLGFALADRVVAELAYAEGVLARPPSAVRELLDRPVDPQRVGRDLDVEYLLTGTLAESGAELHLSVELLDLMAGRVLWKATLEVARGDLFRLEGRVTEAVLRHLGAGGGSSPRAGSRSDVPSHPLAYDYYLRSLAFPVNLEGNGRAVEQLERSVELDPGYAPAWAELGNRRRYLAIYALAGGVTAEQAEEAFQRALELDGGLLEALSGLAKLSVETGETGRACGLLRRALEINPDHAESHFSLSYAYRYGGLSEESIREGELALALDPGNPRFRSVATSHLYAGDLERALEVHELDPESGWTLARAGQIHLRQGREALARDFLERAVEVEPESSTGRWAVAMLAHLDSRPEVGLAALAANEAAGMVDGEQIYHVGDVYCLLGDGDRCLQLVGRAVEHGFFNVPFMLRDAFLDPVRGDPRLEEILAAAAERRRAFEERCGDGGEGG